MGLSCVYTPPQPRKKRTSSVDIYDNDTTTHEKKQQQKSRSKSTPDLVKLEPPQHTEPTPQPSSSHIDIGTSLSTATATLQKELNNNASDPNLLENLKKLQQLQNLQQQQALLLSQINSSIANKQSLPSLSTPPLPINNPLPSLSTPPINNTTNNNNNNNISNQDSLLLPPLIANTPVISNIELNTSSSNQTLNNNNNINNNAWSLNLTPGVNLQSLAMSVAGSMNNNNNMSPGKFNPALLQNLTPSTTNQNKNIIPNLLTNNNNNTTAQPNLASMGLNNMNIDLQEIMNLKNLNGLALMLGNGANIGQLLSGANLDISFFIKNATSSSNTATNTGTTTNTSNNRTVKANNAEVALANMQQQEEENQLASKKNIKNDKNSMDIPNVNSIKNILDNTGLPDISTKKIDNNNNNNNSAIDDDDDDEIKPKLEDSKLDYSVSQSSSIHSIGANELHITNSHSPMNSSTGEQSPPPLDTIPRLIGLSSMAKLNLVDLKLFHHYCSTVWSTITAAGISGPDVWKTYIPDLAFDYPFLMHTILAFSASHLSRTEPGLEKYVQSHRLEALKLLREAVLEISEENTDALVASSLILIMDSLANASNTTNTNDSNTSAWIFHVKGAVTILTAVWPLSESSRFYNLISVDLSDLSDVLNQENRTISELVCFDESISDLYPVEIDSPYLITLAYLDQLHREKNQLDFLLRVFAFPALLDRTFLALLMTGDLGAMRIMRSYYKMLRGFTTEVKDQVWFLEGVSQVLPQDVDEYSGGGGMHMMLDFLGGGLPSMTTTNLSEFM